MIRTQTVIDRSDRAFKHVDAAFGHVDAAFKEADKAFAEADKLFSSLHGEHTRTETSTCVEHTLRFTAPSVGERFKIAKRFFKLGFSLIWRGTGNLCFRNRK